jgi:hypothetical protein
MEKFTVKRTIVKEQPSTDPIAILHPSYMKRFKINTYDYINLKNTVHPLYVSNSSRELEISAQAIGSEHKLSRMITGDEDEYPEDEKTLGKGEIAVDQTCREALVLTIKPRCKVTLLKTGRRYGAKEKLLARLDYQKAIVRVQRNESYFERKTPVVCLCEEAVRSIGADYGDKIEIEYNDKRTTVKCTKLTDAMKEFHDHVLNPSPKTKRKPPTYLEYPEDHGIKSDFSGAEMIHPIFIDTIARDLLDVKVLDPVKIRRDFKWQVLKAVNKLGSISAPIAIPVMVGFAGLEGIEPLSRVVDLIGIFLLSSWLIWSVISSSTYRVSIGND